MRTEHLYNLIQIRIHGEGGTVKHVYHLTSRLGPNLNNTMQ